MESKIEILGLYNVENNKEVHLIEVCIDDIASKIIIDQITQETLGQSKENWQVAYDEHYLDITGTQVVGYFRKTPNDEIRPTRIAFFMYYINFELPLITQYGQTQLPQPTEIPNRLKEIIEFVDND